MSAWSAVNVPATSIVESESLTLTIAYFNAPVPPVAPTVIVPVLKPLHVFVEDTPVISIESGIYGSYP